MAQTSNPSEFRRDILIYFSIIVLLGIILFISHLHLGLPGIVLIVAIACIEASILAYYFMHLIHRQKTIQILLLLTVIVVLNLLFWPAWDISYGPRTSSELTHF